MSLASRLEERPKVGKLVVPFVVDALRIPIDFREMDLAHVRACADRRLCGVCGQRIELYEALAFIGPRTLIDRACFADPWMHEDCAKLALEQCPFLDARRGWRDPAEEADRLLAPYSHQMALRLAPAGRAHQDAFKAWHFEALGALTEVAE